ncbi:MAG: MBL fold metallo-hydrolase [Chitinophagaceae bacterium]
MQIKQFEDKNLSHYSYAVVIDCERMIVLIDPARDTERYYDFARETETQIVAVIETHPHADFVSSHLELHQSSGAIIYASKDTQAHYPHQAFDEGQSIQLGKIKLTAINTPGHSPDSICILLEHEGIQKVVFTGDTLFIGDCGRPDLREDQEKMQSKREDLAKQMFHSLRNKLMKLNDDVVVYPTHGAGSLCGKNLSEESRSTIGREKQTNWCLQEATEEEFINNLLEDQPFVPQYFPYNVELNLKGAAPLKESIKKITIKDYEENAERDGVLWVVDTRNEETFKKGHLPHSVNLMEKGKFETWLGSIIKPKESFYLAGESKEQLERMIKRTASIGYETAIKEAIIVIKAPVQEAEIDMNIFKNHPDKYTIVDVRNESEVKEGKIFPNSIPIPLAEVRSRVDEIPTDKPIVVHCEGGYRSAAASSIIHSSLNGMVKVFDLGEAIREFQEH